MIAIGRQPSQSTHQPNSTAHRLNQQTTNRLARQEIERRQADTEHNRGVYYRATLRAAPASAAAAAARGIRRAADKLVLPPSVGAILMAQEAFKNGVSSCCLAR